MLAPVCPKERMMYWNSWRRLGCSLLPLFTFLLWKFFLLPFLGKEHPQQVFKVLLGFKKSKFLPSFQICLVQAYLLITHYDPEKAFSCLLLSASSVQLHKSNLFSHLGTFFPIMKQPPTGRENSRFTKRDGSFLFLFHDTPFWRKNKKKFSEATDMPEVDMNWWLTRSTISWQKF